MFLGEPINISAIILIGLFVLVLLFLVIQNKGSKNHFEEMHKDLLERRKLEGNDRLKKSIKRILTNIFCRKIPQYDKEGTNVIDESIQIKKRYFFILGFISIGIGGSLVANEYFLGIGLILTVAPCLFLYPLVRAVVSYGKDTMKSAIWTLIVEEYLKFEIMNRVKKKEKRRRKF